MLHHDDINDANSEGVGVGHLGYRHKEVNPIATIPFRMGCPQTLPTLLPQICGVVSSLVVWTYFIIFHGPR